MNYYNEFDPNAAAWLKELIAEGLIPKGEVDERSITDVAPDDLRGYTQCHFFAGIGGWNYALQRAGWDADRPVWTGSCPCQAFSAAGKQKGFADDRDLWPAFFRLIRECRPEYVFGEQVENAVKHGWLDRVYADLEAEGYACGSVVLGAHSVGAPHQRQRLYWGGAMAKDPDGGGRRGRHYGNPSGNNGQIQAPGLRGACGVANDNDKRCKEQRGTEPMGAENARKTPRSCFELRSGACGVEYPARDGLDGVHQECGEPAEKRRMLELAGASDSGAAWERCRYIWCQDRAVRRIPAESVFFGVADGLPERMDRCGLESVSQENGFPLTRQKEGRPMLLKGYGNAIVPQVAAEFIKAFMENEIEK
jgi:DNA (cytosine-5)-methyltransferase 1